MLVVCMPFSFLRAAARAATNDIDGWIDKAISLGLDKSRTWQVLGHYKPHADGWKSLISDTNFFLAPSGNENPRAELAATIRAWLDTNTVGQPADCACRFPARICWLKSALNVPASRIPGSICKNDLDLMHRIAPHEAVLVFPSAAFKGMGAMFGHTLIRFDAMDKRPLISYSVSYAALSGNESIFAYVWKGLTGGFNGYYSLAPYYQKLHEYRDMEERDVWEYPLNLNPDEVNMMVLHSIELQNIATKYYFLDENCALNLLFIIEAGRPSLRLVEHYWNQPAFWVIPSDTVLFLWHEGILNQPEFEASLSRQIDFFAQHCRQPIIDEAKRLARPIARFSAIAVSVQVPRMPASRGPRRRATVSPLRPCQPDRVLPDRDGPCSRRPSGVFTNSSRVAKPCRLTRSKKTAATHLNQHEDPVWGGRNPSLGSLNNFQYTSSGCQEPSGFLDGN